MYKHQPKRWDIDPATGFMRARVCFLKYGVMAYASQEINGAAPEPDPVYMMVDMDALSNPEAIRSLEGMPVMIGHDWADTSGKYNPVGSVAGTPYMNGPYLEGYIVVTCPETIRKIQSNELHDISAAYDFTPVMDEGEVDGMPYHGRQTQLRYNHVALLPPGRGRGGEEVRVINQKDKTGAKTMDFTSVQVIGNLRVRVANEDMGILNEALRELDGKVEAVRVEVKNQMGGELETALAKMEELNTQIASLMEEKASYEGKLQTLREQLDQALDPAGMEDSVNQMVEERDEAAETMMKNAGDMYKDKDKVMNELKGLSGDALRLAVVEKIRVANSLSELSDEQKKDNNFIRGAYEVYAANKANAKKKPHVPGSAALKRASVQNVNEQTSSERVRRVVFGKKSA
jgi:predicted transcriptional regulator